MAPTNLSDETKAYGTFLTNFLNCKLDPNSMSSLVNECLHIIKQYLRYDNPKWNKVQITSLSTFNELVSITEHGYFKDLIVPCFQIHALGGHHPDKDWIFDERRNKLIKKAFRKHNDSANKWRKKDRSIYKEFVFFIDFALYRKNFRRIINRMINQGETLEQIRNDKYLGNFILRLGSEYKDLTQQFIISNNQTRIGSQMTDLPEMTYSPESFLEGFILPCLSYCLFKGSEHGIFFKRIKLCPVCHIFFMAGRLNQIYCSKKCKRMKNWPREKWNKYIQDRRVMERLEKQKTHEVDREKEIQKRMIAQGLTREEATEQIDFDDNL